jgi:predicted thioredoxin/glutaredoxin
MKFQGNHKRKLSIAQIEEICRLYNEGESMRQLGFKFGVTQQVIKYWLLRQNNAQRVILPSRGYEMSDTKSAFVASVEALRAKLAALETEANEIRVLLQLNGMLEVK